MDHINRVYDAIIGQTGVPFAKGELVIDNGFAKAFLKWINVEKGRRSSAKPEDNLLACCRLLNMDLVCLQSKDVRKHCSGPEQMGRYIGRFSGEGLFVFWVVNGAYQSASKRMGFHAFHMNCAENPKAVFEKISEISREVIRETALGVKAGVHGIIIADDIAYAQGLLVSPRFAETYLMPLWTEQVKAAKRFEVPVFFHSDGNINSLLPLIEAAGFDGLQCIEPAASMNIGKVKSAYGKKLCLMGNLDPSLLIDRPDSENAKGNYSKLARAVKELLYEVSPGGRFIFGTCSGLYAGMSPERVFFMHRLADKFNMEQSKQFGLKENPI